MKALLISQYYNPEKGFITADVAELLAASGIDTVVLTTFPSFPQGKFYDSVKSIWPSKAKENNVNVWRIPHYPSHNLSKVKRFFSYISFCFGSLFFVPFVARRPKIVIVYQTPFTSAIPSLWHKWVSKSKLVYIVADLWPESFSASGLLQQNSTIINLMYKYSRWINSQADLIICSTKGTAQRYNDDGISNKKLAYIPVWTQCPENIDNYQSSNTTSAKTIIYAGNIGPAQSLNLVIDAAALLKQKNMDVKFHIYGIGPDLERHKKRVEELKLDNVIFFGRVDPQEVISASMKADAQLVHLAKSPLFEMTIPSKLFFSLSLGKPMFCGLSGESKAIAEDSGSAIMIEQENGEDFANKIIEFIDLPTSKINEMGNAGREYYLKNFDKEILLAKYKEQIFELLQ